MPTNNVNPTPEPIVVTSAQGVTDALQAVIRYLIVIVGFLSGLGSLLGKHDAASAVAYMQTNLGDTVAAIFGLVALGTAAYGIYKSYKRGSQLSTVAADDRVPDRVAKISN
jgi:hypothetical protein